MSEPIPDIQVSTSLDAEMQTVLEDVMQYLGINNKSDAMRFCLKKFYNENIRGNQK